MLSCLNRLSVRYFLIFLAIFIYILIDSFLCLLDTCVMICCYPHPPGFLSPDFLIDRLVKHIYANLFLVACGSPPLLSLLLLRRPSFWRVLFHVVITFYPLWILTKTGHFPVDCYAGNVLWVVSGATFVAGLPEAMAAGRWARLVYYAVLLFWLSLIAPLVAKLLS
jgi:hypothetical protein